MKQRHIIYIINPISGTRTKTNLQQLIVEKTTAAHIPFQIFPSVANGDYSFLFSIIQEEKITDVVIAGGDGTVNQVINSLKNFKISFGIIPCGSGNGLANSASISKNPQKAIQIILNGKAKEIDAFTMNHHFSCMLCGLGLDAKVAHEFAEQPKRGLATYTKLTLHNFFKMKQHRFTIHTAQCSFEASAYFISIANSNQFGNHVKIAPKASLSDGLLDVVIVTNKNKFSFLINAVKQLAGWNRLKPITAFKENRGVLYFQTDKITISNTSLAPLHIDGDPAETSDEFRIAIIQNCFKLLMPE
ncbi:MAG: YegS/Rv2252/BmrU family lipid kinase [Bacteroidetes bacterium]|nr:YegS/Rv2252/BmrU family lipid kinase [Bacteroidota bacterium]